jgi:hypothetical protein
MTLLSIVQINHRCSFFLENENGFRAYIKRFIQLTTDNTEGEKQFRDALSTQIHELLGHEPRITLAESGHAIYYS